MAPKRRKPLTKKDGIVTSAADDNTSASNAKNDMESTAKAVSKKRPVTKTTQKVINKTRQTKVSSKQKQDTASSNNRDKHLLENSASQSCKEAEAESTTVEKTRNKRLSKMKAMSKITGHFEDVEITPPRDGSALVKAERKIWEDIAGMQKNECGLTERKRGSRRTVGNCRGNEEEMEEEVGDDETESGAKKSKSRTERKRKGENKSTSCEETGTKQMKMAEKGKDEQKDAVYNVKDDMEMDAGSCVQETAKGNKYIGAHTSIAGKGSLIHDNKSWLVYLLCSFAIENYVHCRCVVCDVTLPYVINGGQLIMF